MGGRGRRAAAGTGGVVSPEVCAGRPPSNFRAAGWRRSSRPQHIRHRLRHRGKAVLPSCANGCSCAAP